MTTTYPTRRSAIRHLLNDLCGEHAPAHIRVVASKKIITSVNRTELIHPELPGRVYTIEEF